MQLQSFFNFCGGHRTSYAVLFLSFCGVGPGMEPKSAVWAASVFIHLAGSSIRSLKDTVTQLVSVSVCYATAPQAGQDCVLGHCCMYQAGSLGACQQHSLHCGGQGSVEFLFLVSSVFVHQGDQAKNRLSLDSPLPSLHISGSSHCARITLL